MQEGIIYLFTNKVNGKKYVGQTVQTLANRRYKHRWDAKNSKYNSIFHKALLKYGEDAFTLEVIAESLAEFLDDLEIFFIKLHASRSHQHGYNMNEGGGGQRGHRHSDESKAKVSAGNKGKKVSAEVCEAARLFHTGRKHSQESKVRMSAAARGKKRSPETKARISAAGMGRPCSEETRMKMSSTRKGRICSAEHKLALSLAALRRSTINRNS